ncbi:MAG TPA: efflux transporter outer membrane subunit [Spongiibacteraceae bacterium]|nr:efflux transporter outer membrane subunit [Spongiibacteraceae bacterium]
MRKLVLALVLPTLSACAVGPDYKRPSTVVDPPAGSTDAQLSNSFKEAQSGGWKIAEPSDTTQRGDWWRVFGDEQLDALQTQLIAANQNVAAAEARYRQARASAQAARAGFFPDLTLSAASTRGKTSSSQQLTLSSSVVTQDTATLDASWELDVWGRIRREVEAGEASAQASSADFAAALLSAQAELAQNYFLLRVTDAQRALLDRTVADYEKSLQLTQNQYNVGVASRADVTQAQAQLKAAQAQAVDIDITRAQLEHAVAILVGKAPAELTIAVKDFKTALPDIPLSLPSTLLERRPDIAAAERRVVAANAQVGVARAAYFPQLTLSASGGYRSNSFSDWFTAPNRFWSIGPALSLPLFDAGLRSAQNKQAIAAYDETVANYRQTVLGSLQEVEDNLVALNRLAQEVRFQQEAVAASQEALRLVNNQYKAGTVSFLNVLTAETTAFTNERNLLQAQGRQFTASVLLIKALGGGWGGSLAQTE